MRQKVEEKERGREGGIKEDDGLREYEMKEKKGRKNIMRKRERLERKKRWEMRN